MEVPPVGIFYPLPTSPKYDNEILGCGFKIFMSDLGEVPKAVGVGLPV